LIADVDEFDHCQSLFSSVALRGRGISTRVKAALHIVNIDFELN